MGVVVVVLADAEDVAPRARNRSKQAHAIEGHSLAGQRRRDPGEQLLDHEQSAHVTVTVRQRKRLDAGFVRAQAPHFLLSVHAEYGKFHSHYLAVRVSKIAGATQAPARPSRAGTGSAAISARRSAISVFTMGMRMISMAKPILPPGTTMVLRRDMNEPRIMASR